MTEQAAHESHDGGRDRILVADDSLPMRLFVLNVVSNLGFTGVGVERGDLALQRLHEESFEYLITELWLPGMDGLALVRGLGALPPGRRRPKVIMCSVEIDPALVARQPEFRSVAAMLRKPLSARDIADALHHAAGTVA